MSVKADMPELDHRRNRNIQIGLAVFLGIWLTSSIALGLRGAFDQAGEPPVYFGLFLGGPIVVSLLAYAISESFRRMLLALPLWSIVAVHVLRFVGIFFILDAINGTLPPQFAWPAGLGDIAAAAFSIPLALALHRGVGSKGIRKKFIAWNIFGLIDLSMAIIVGMLYSQSTFGILSEPDLHSQAVTHMPVSLIPTFYVPLLILLHLLALRRRKEVGAEN
jgi:hypothetical protein